MIDPESVCLETLPSLPIEQRKVLPAISGIYFAIDSLGNVQYIGRSVNINQRWKAHHRYTELEELLGINIAWIEISQTSLLPEIELALIEWFNPPLNGVQFHPPNPRIPTKPNNIRWKLNEVMARRRARNKDLAEALNLNPSYVSRLRKQDYMPGMNPSTLAGICQFLCCQPGDLLVYVKKEGKP